MYVCILVRFRIGLVVPILLVMLHWYGMGYIQCTLLLVMLHWYGMGYIHVHYGAF